MNRVIESGYIKNRKHESVKLFLMVLPCIGFVFLFSYLPLWGWLYSVIDYKIGTPLFDCEFVGLKYYTTLFRNPVRRLQLFNSLKNTFGMAILDIIFSPLTPTFAIFLNEMNRTKYKKFIQTATALPYFVSWVIVYSLAFYMFSTEGFVNNLLMLSGITDSPVNFLTSTNNVWLAMKGYQIWKNLGWSAIVYLAAISSIDPTLYDAAMIDGANRMQRIWHISVPGIIPTYFVLLIMQIGHFLNVGMEQYLLFGNAMNMQNVEVLDLFVYHKGIDNGQISFATAIGIMKSVVSLVLFTFANIFSKRVRGTSIF